MDKDLKLIKAKDSMQKFEIDKILQYADVL